MTSINISESSKIQTKILDLAQEYFGQTFSYEKFRLFYKSRNGYRKQMFIYYCKENGVQNPNFWLHQISIQKDYHSIKQLIEIAAQGFEGLPKDCTTADQITKCYRCFSYDWKRRFNQYCKDKTGNNKFGQLLTRYASSQDEEILSEPLGEQLVQIGIDCEFLKHGSSYIDLVAVYMKTEYQKRKDFLQHCSDAGLNSYNVSNYLTNDVRKYIRNQQTQLFIPEIEAQQYQYSYEIFQ